MKEYTLIIVASLLVIFALLVVFITVYCICTRRRAEKDDAALFEDGINNNDSGINLNTAEKKID